MNQFVGYENIIPLLAPVDMGSTAKTTGYVDLRAANHFAFLVSIGNIDSATTTDVIDITVEAATAPTGTEAAIGFSYRKSGIVTANTWATITEVVATATLAVGVTDDSLCYWIEVDVPALAANDYRYVRLKATDNPDMTACLISVLGFIDPIYKQSTHLAATAAASA